MARLFFTAHNALRAVRFFLTQHNALRAVRLSRLVILLAGILWPGMMAAADLHVDHVTIAGTHLDALRKAFTAATGLPTEYGGPHSNHATEMALTSFPDGSYLELMGIQEKADPVAVSMHEWSAFLKNKGGPCAFALRVSDVAAEAGLLTAAGIPTGKPEASGRTRPDGTKIAWETVGVGPGHRGSLFPFLISDSTPRELRVYPSGKPSTDRAIGVGKVVIGVRNVEDAIEQYRRAFGLSAPHRERNGEFRAAMAWFEGTPFVLAQGVDERSLVAERVREYGEAPIAFVLAMRGTADVRGTQGRWFGHSVVWLDEQGLGWLGVEAGK